MLKNFIEMPPILKALLASAFVVPVFCINSMLPGRSVYVSGQKIPVSLWWGSGMGPMTLVLSIIMIFSAFLMLRRLSLGRLVYVVGWVLMVATFAMSGRLLSIVDASFNAMLYFNLGVSILVAIYLYKSRRVDDYFSS